MPWLNILLFGLKRTAPVQYLFFTAPSLEARSSKNFRQFFLEYERPFSTGNRKMTVVRSSNFLKARSGFYPSLFELHVCGYL
jgi:hypothetical protein